MFFPSILGPEENLHSRGLWVGRIRWPPRLRGRSPARAGEFADASLPWGDHQVLDKQNVNQQIQYRQYRYRKTPQRCSISTRNSENEWQMSGYTEWLRHMPTEMMQNCQLSLASAPHQELNIGVSLSLWRALQEDRLDDCRRLLQEKAHGLDLFYYVSIGEEKCDGTGT